MSLVILHRRRVLQSTSEPVTTPNTYIKGMASAITTQSELASRLQISSAYIPYFHINGEDIEAYININYTIPNSCFSQDVITEYIDIEGKVSHVGDAAFYGYSCLIEKVDFPSATSTDNNVFYSNRFLLEVNIPLVTNLGVDSGDNNIFGGTLLDDCIINANSYLQTNNSGGMDGDLVEAEGNNATINWV